MDPKVERLQNHLALIRTSAGWSTTELGEKLGVSRQMISNIESGRNKMTMMQYRAIRHALNEEIASSN
ncbi:MAG: helix-turn-helix domain-containing protein, partial [Clostridium sp.]|nr:helix-turn-helix domain-containing protein [Clostridium sp.]